MVAQSSDRTSWLSGGRTSIHNFGASWVKIGKNGLLFNVNLSQTRIGSISVAQA
jgi:hypothetical protein